MLLPFARLAGLALALWFACWPAVAFDVFPNGSGGLLKWGDDQQPGSPGSTVTWGFIPVGTPGSSFCGDACPGNAVNAINVENAPGAGYSVVPLTALQARIEAAFAKWSQVADIRFVHQAGDSGLPINDPAATTPDIRIGVFAFASGGGAVGYAPPPNGGTGAGDILFDANSFYAFQPGADGDAFPSASTAPNDFDSLLLHEMGHAIGLAHPVFDGSCPVMQIEPACLFKINRELDADDVAGVRYLYGPAATTVASVPALPPVAVTLLATLIGLFGARRLARRPA